MTNVSVHQSGLCPSSKVVEHMSESPPRIEVLNLATFTGRYKMAKTYILIKENDTCGGPSKWIVPRWHSGRKHY